MGALFLVFSLLLGGSPCMDGDVAVREGAVVRCYAQCQFDWPGESIESFFGTWQEPCRIFGWVEDDNNTPEDYSDDTFGLGAELGLGWNKNITLARYDRLFVIMPVVRLAY